MNLQRKIYNTQGEKILDFFVGFVGFFLVNGILWAVVSVADGILGAATASGNNFDSTGGLLPFVSLVLYCGVFLINVAAMILAGLTRYWIALGLLGAFTLSLILVICASIVIGGLCFGLLYGLSQPSGGALIWSGLQWLW